MQTGEYIKWKKAPFAKIKDIYVCVEEKDFPDYHIDPEYYPADNINDILNTLRNIYQNKDVLNFVQEWGFLKHVAFNHRLLDPTKAEYREVNGESIMDIISVARSVRNYSMLKYLLKKYEDAKNGYEDYFVVEDETNEWLEAKPDILPLNAKSFMDTSKIAYEECLNTTDQIYISYNEYLLDFAIQGARFSVSKELKNGASLQIEQETGYPTLLFSNLQNFIYYMLLAETTTKPERCHDPKCNQIFFPVMKGQKYCPKLPHENRSRCEQRHGKALRREAKKKTQVN